MSEKLIGSCIFGQSGGPTSVINASAYGVIRAALDAPEITKVYGAAHGIQGVLNDQLYVMDEEDPEELRLLLHTPSSELGSCRYKMADPEKDDKDYKRILETIGRRGFAGLGAVVLKDVADDAVVAGVPAKEINKNK